MRTIWVRIAAFFLRRQLKTGPDAPLDFARLLNEPKDWLLVMPAEANAFDAALPLCLDLLERVQGIRMHLLVPHDFRHWITVKTPMLKVHPFHPQDLIWGRFPRRALIERLHNLKPDVAMDLSPLPTPLSLYACAHSGAQVRGAISRKYGDEVFNFLVQSGAEDIGERYRTLFAYLS
ncbi:MAG: hypothetical protein C4524_11835 [Candidatus Zixiibacteriota bacterium]|nr:MAG: hypothetical protein C4524_11835 [candidate division Zixibacteria bacterium]